MSWQYHPYVLPCLITAGVAALLTLGAWGRRNAPGALPFALLIIGVVIWSLGYAAGLASTSLASKIFWAQIQYFGIASIPVFWLLMALQFTGRTRRLTRRNLALLFAIPLITWFLVWTNSSHGLIWSETRLVSRGEIVSLALEYGTWFWISWSYMYLLLLGGIGAFILAFIRLPGLYREQSLVILIGCFIPVAGNLVRILGLSPIPDLDLTPFAFTLSGVFLGWGLLRFRLFDIVPVARSAVMESMGEGVIVLDLMGRVVDINPAACRFIQQEADAAIGQPLDQVLSIDEEFIYQNGQPVIEISLGSGQGERVFEVQVSAINDRRAQSRGRLLVLRDITERNRSEEYLRESEERFRKLAEASFEGVVISEDGVVMDANQQLVEIFGYQQVDDLIGKRASELVPPTELEKVRPLYAAGVEQTYQSTILRKDGSLVPVEVRGKNMRYQGRNVRIAAFRDISERLKVEEKLRRRAEELAALHTLSLEIISSRDLPVLLERIVEKAVTLLGGSGGGLYLCEKKERLVRCVVSYKTSKDYRGTVLRFGEGAAGIAAETGKPLLVEDYRTWIDRAHVFDEDQPFRSVVSAPLLWQDQVIGVIHVLQYTEGEHFTQNDLELLTLFANQAAIAIENANHLKEIQIFARRMAMLNEITRVAVSAPNLEVILKQLADRLGELFDASGVFITLWDEVQRVPIPSAASGEVNDLYTNLSTKPGEANMTAAVLQAGRALVVDDVSQSSYVSQRIASLFPIRSVMGVPLIADGRKLGVAFISYSELHSFSEDEIALGEQAGAQVALAIAKTQSLESEKRRTEELARVNAIIQQLAITDELTSLYNRRGLMELGGREVERALRFQRPLSGIMLDIDRFKQVNDQYGHPIGDVVLRELADCLRQSVRTIDIVGRYGGEEFFILLPETDLTPAVQVAERIRERVGNTAFAVILGNIHITISAGVTNLQPGAMDLEALLAHTDQELYNAKNSGRNRVAYSH